MITLPEKSDAVRLHDFLIESGYTEDGLKRSLGQARPPEEGGVQTMLHRTHVANAGSALARLFLVGVDVEKDSTEAVLPEWFLELCIGTGMLRATNVGYRASVVSVPVGGFLIASDAFRILGADEASEFVLPASTHSANYLRQLIITNKVDRALDLGTGCGVHALFMSLHSTGVIASDISERATRYAELNALLNGRDNIKCVTGDRFSAIVDQKFDLIVSNPPFVLGPDEEFTYRDNKLELDEFCRQLVAEAAGHLNEGGHLQMLCESVEFDGESWKDRMMEWTANTGCDTWLLHSPPLRPANYTATRLSDIRGGPDPGQGTFDRWLNYFTDKNVTGIHPVLMVLRRRDAANWFHVHDLASDLSGDAGPAILRGITARDFLHEHDDESKLFDAVLELSPFLTLEQQFSRVEDHWEGQKSVLALTDGMPMEAEIDMPVMAFLNQMDGSRNVRECVSRFAEAAKADEKKIAGDFLPIVRLFIARGFLRAG